MIAERHEAAQQVLAELRRANQHLADQNQRLQTELANNEVQRSGLEAQIRLASWPSENAGTGIGSNKDEELMRQLQSSQRERMELRGKVESLSDKVTIVIFMLKRRKDSDTYLATICRHRWSRQFTMKIDKILELSDSTVAFIS